MLTCDDTAPLLRPVQKAAYQASHWQQDPSQSQYGGGYYSGQGYGGAGYDGYGAADASYGSGAYQAQPGGYGYQQQVQDTLKHSHYLVYFPGHWGLHAIFGYLAECP